MNKKRHSTSQASVEWEVGVGSDSPHNTHREHSLSHPHTHHTHGIGTWSTCTSAAGSVLDHSMTGSSFIFFFPNKIGDLNKYIHFLPPRCCTPSAWRLHRRVCNATKRSTLSSLFLALLLFSFLESVISIHPCSSPRNGELHG